MVARIIEDHDLLNVVVCAANAVVGIENELCGVVLGD
jgi:hypothetical protein